jgi:hypothetical protein
MVSRIVAVALVLCPFTVWAQLDLSPQLQISELEGVRTEITAFRNGTDLVTWQPPHHWRLSGGGRQVTLSPPNTAHADAMVEIVDLAAGPVLDQAFARSLKEQVVRSLPREVTELQWAEDEANPLLMNQHPTYKVTLSYTLFAQRYTKAMWVCNFAAQQLRFHFTARAADYEKLHELFRQSLYTWQGLK